MASKSAGKQFLGKVCGRLCRYPVGQKFCRNRSISLHFRNNRAFVFNAAIQDGCQKWPENFFLVKVASRLVTYPVGQKFHQSRSISLRFRDKRIFAFNPEIQDGHKKWQDNNFCEKLPVDSADTLWVKIFVKLLYLTPFPRYMNFQHYEKLLHLVNR